MRDKWQARGKVGGTEFYMGTYKTPEEAAVAAHLWRLENLPGYTGRDIKRDSETADTPMAKHLQEALFYVFNHAGAA